MVKLKNFEIILSKPNSTYTAGSTVSGFLKLNSNERFKINSISLLVEGHAKVNWSEKKSTLNGRNSKTVYEKYTNHEEYISLNKLLLFKQEEKDLLIEKGEHTYSFEFNLPNHLPGSVKHPLGYIQYCIKATLDIPRGFNKHTDKIFKVITRLDLNQLSLSLRQPMQINESKQVLFLFGGVIYASFRLHKCGFVPGEVVTFEAFINNTSKRNVIRNRIKLIQYLKLTGTKENLTKTREEKREIARIVIDKTVKGNTKKEINLSEPFILPLVCTTLDGMCRIIHVKYAILFTFGIRGSSDKELEIPITIGSVPFQNESENFDNENLFH